MDILFSGLYLPHLKRATKLRKKNDIYIKRPQKDLRPFNMSSIEYYFLKKS